MPSRNDITQKWECENGGRIDVRAYDQGMTEMEMAGVLEGVDGVVECADGQECGKEWMRAVGVASRRAEGNGNADGCGKGVDEGSGVRLYFPYEFGVDYRLLVWRIQGCAEWEAKEQHDQFAREVLLGNVQVCRGFSVVLSHAALGPGLGVEEKKRVVEGVGGPDVKVSSTNVVDVARCVAILSARAMRGEAVPGDVRISGLSRSVNEAVEIVRRDRKNEVELRYSSAEDDRVMRIECRSEQSEPLRYAMGKGLLDYRDRNKGGLGNDNEVVNEGGKEWIWRGLEKQEGKKNRNRYKRP